MVYFFAAITLALLIFALRDEFRPGGSLHIQLTQLVEQGHPDFAHLDPYDLAELLEFPIHDGWERDDVVRTLAEISSL